ncbi:Protein required for ethanol metabolism [Umbelopsis sp. WA50703]
MRTLRLTGFGGLVAAPLLSNWYKFLDKNIRLSSPFKSLIARVGLDQCLFAPSFIALFFSAQGALEGKSMTQIKEKLDDGYPQALLNNYKLWPAVQFFNFYVTPLNHRLMVTNIVALGWNTYLSTANQKSSSHIAM